MKRNLLLLVLILFLSCTQDKQINFENSRTKKTNVEQQNYLQSEPSDLKDGWFLVTEAVVVENITPEEAKEKAIQKACKSALEYFSGVEVSSRIIDLKAENQDEILLDDFSSLTQQTTQGIVLDKEIIDEKTLILGNQIKKVVTLKVKVDKQEGEKDPGFEMRANLNRDYFKNGEEIKLNVKPTKDCYLTVINICSNDSVYVIFPNKYNKNNHLQAKHEFRLPSKRDEEIGLRYKATLLAHKEEDVEIIKLIATKKKIDFSSLYSFSAYGTYKTTLLDLHRWLLKIPRNEIEEVDLQYFITN